MKLEHIKDLIQSCNLNFLFGSGTSNPYLSTLGNIELVLTEIEKQEEKDKYDKIIKASLYKKYCEDVIIRNLYSVIKSYKEEYLEKEKKGDDLEGDKYLQYESVFDAYKKLLLNLNEILLFRNNNLLTKQVNLFTTNIDLFLEKTLEQTNLEFNDGFKGRTKPIYDLSNFQKSYSKTSSHYDNISEIPVFNLLKIHGSINWGQNNEGKVVFKNSLSHVVSIQKKLQKISDDFFIEVEGNENYEELYEKASEIELDDENIFDVFFEEYSKLIMVNPTKEKFKKSVIDEEYYELLRIYANSLEKENTVLFVIGFSFADEHIKNVTIRAANSNPTLQIIIFLYKDEEMEGMTSKLKDVRNNNLQLITPKLFTDMNKESDEKLNPRKEKLIERVKNFDCETICEEIFGEIKGMVRYRNLNK